MNTDNDISQRLADRATVEIHVQSVRILKVLARAHRAEDMRTFLLALRTGTLRQWEIELEGIRGKRLFKKSIAIVRSLTDDMIASDVLDKSQMRELEALYNGCLVGKRVATIPQMSEKEEISHVLGEERKKDEHSRE